MSASLRTPARGVWAAVFAALLASYSSFAAAPPQRTEDRTDALPILDGSSPESRVASSLRTLRERGREAHDAGPELVALLSERSAIFDGRGPREVERIRAALLATLAAIGPPPEALPIVLAELTFGHRPLGLAAAARAAGSFGPLAVAAVPSLLSILGPFFHDDEVSLGDEPTSARLEAVRALSRIGAAARAALPTLLDLARDTVDSPTATVLAREARLAVVAISGEPGAAGDARPAGPPQPSPWIAAGERGASPLSKVRLTDQQGRSWTFPDPRGLPLALTFAYTRCDNPNKCPLTLEKMAALQRLLARSRAQPAAALAVISLDPDFDDGDHLVRFATQHGFRLDSLAAMIRPHPEDLPALESSLQVAVNRGAGQVNGHGVELFLFDRQGRLARRYYGAAWSNDRVERDLQRLAAERP